MALVIHHGDFDVLIPGHSRIGKLSGGTRISMLLDPKCAAKRPVIPNLDQYRPVSVFRLASTGGRIIGMKALGHRDRGFEAAQEGSSAAQTILRRPPWSTGRWAPFQCVALGLTVRADAGRTSRTWANRLGPAYPRAMERRRRLAGLSPSFHPAMGRVSVNSHCNLLGSSFEEIGPASLGVNYRFLIQFRP